MGSPVEDLKVDEEQEQEQGQCYCRNILLKIYCRKKNRNLMRVKALKVWKYIPIITRTRSVQVWKFR